MPERPIENGHGNEAAWTAIANVVEAEARGDISGVRLRIAAADLAPRILDALRSLPVEQRMEAMGMTRWDDVAGYEPGSMVPVFIERDTDA